MKKLIIRVGLILTSSFVLAAPLALAQNAALIEGIRVELQRTDEIIDRAREMVRASNAPASALTLERAIGLQKQAWDNFYKGTVAGYTIASKLSLQAREQAKQALSNARFSEQGADAVLNRLERTDDLLAQAHEDMPAKSGVNLDAIYDSARRNLAQAWEFYRKGQYRPAIKLANQVERTAKKLIEISNRRENSEANFQRRLETVKQFIDRVQEQVANCQSDAAKTLIQKAKEALEQANNFGSKGQFEPAFKHLQQARRMAGDAAALCGKAPEINAGLERLKSEAERLKDEIKPGDDTATRLLDQVFGQLENARGFIAKQDNESAVAALRAGQLTLKQLRRYLENGEN